jgi:GAF domain-containing protein
MPSAPSDKIRECLARAADLGLRAAAAADPEAQAQLRRLELQWLQTAETYALVERSAVTLEILAARRAAADERLAASLKLDWITPEAPAPADAGQLADRLGVLVRTAVEFTHGKARAAFYLADREGKTLHHVTGMPQAYAKCVDGFAIGKDSLACGLCVSTQRPVITPDVFADPRWRPWLWLPKQFDYRACWSFPIETGSGQMLGSFAMYHEEPTEATSHEIDFAAAVTRAASSIIPAF